MPAQLGLSSLLFWGTRDGRSGRGHSSPAPSHGCGAGCGQAGCFPDPGTAPPAWELCLHPQPCPAVGLPPSPGAHQGELVGDLAVGRQLGAEAVGGEELVAVVVLDDLPNGLERQGIGAELVGAGVVQRGGLRRHPCGTAPVGTTLPPPPPPPPPRSAPSRPPRSPLEAVKSMATVKFSWVLGGRAREAAGPTVQGSRLPAPRHGASSTRAPQPHCLAPCPSQHPQPPSRHPQPVVSPSLRSRPPSRCPGCLGSLGTPVPTHPPRM